MKAKSTKWWILLFLEVPVDYVCANLLLFKGGVPEQSAGEVVLNYTNTTPSFVPQDTPPPSRRGSIHMQWQTQILSEFENVIHEILGVISDDYTKGTKQSACVVCLHGELGAGKTTAVQIIGKILGITETVNSPTFVIKKTYRTTTEPFQKLVHIDAYRLKLEDNLTLFEFEKDFSEPGTLVLIEWPEMIQSMIPENAFHMYIDHDKEGRVIRFENKKTA